MSSHYSGEGALISTRPTVYTQFVHLLSSVELYCDCFLYDWELPGANSSKKNGCVQLMVYVVDRGSRIMAQERGLVGRVPGSGSCGR